MELVRWDQVEGVNRIQSRINELFEDTFGRPRAQQSAAAGVWYPPVDILESKDSYLIRAELPGMRKEDLKTEVNEGILTLSGERKFEEPASGVEYHRVERVTGKFSRSFHLPQTVKHDGIKATYRDGILEVQVPKADEAKPKSTYLSVEDWLKTSCRDLRNSPRRFGRKNACGAILDLGYRVGGKSRARKSAISICLETVVTRERRPDLRICYAWRLRRRERIRTAQDVERALAASPIPRVAR
jgi:HSP20 family protein